MENQSHVILFSPSSGALGSSSENEPDNEPIQILSLPHPVTYDPKTYTMMPGSHSLMEIQTIEMPFRSWTVDDFLIGGSRSSMITTPMNPVYLLLAVLERADGTAKNQFTALEDLLHDDAYPDLHKLVTCILDKHLEILCDVNEIGGNRYYRLCKTKALSWVESRLQRLFEQFDSIKMFQDASRHKKSATDVDKYRFIIDVLSEYVSDQWLSPLETKLIPEEPEKTEPRTDPTMYFDDKLLKRPLPDAEGAPSQKAQKKKVVKKPPAPAPSKTKPLTAFFAKK